MMTNRFLLFLTTTLVTTNLFGSINPLSKIVIESKRASCHKDKVLKNTFVFTYRDQVSVTLADKSTIKADELEIIIDGSSTNKTNQAATKELGQDKIKKIMFKNNVVINSSKRNARAAYAEIIPSTQQCKLEGNVSIWQAKQSLKDIPVSMQSTKAIFNLKTHEVALLGDEKKPVMITITLNSFSTPITPASSTMTPSNIKKI